jgi:hypothetical protein
MANNAPNRLSPKQEAAIVALLNEPTVRRAAESIKVGERTLHRWMDDEAFSREYRKARRLAFSQAISLTQKYTPLAVQTLAKVTTDTDAPHAAKVSAASALLRFSRESIELDDVVERVEKLERDAVARDEKGGGR